MSILVFEAVRAKRVIKSSNEPTASNRAIREKSPMGPGLFVEIVFFFLSSPNETTVLRGIPETSYAGRLRLHAVWTTGMIVGG